MKRRVCGARGPPGSPRGKLIPLFEKMRSDCGGGTAAVVASVAGAIWKRKANALGIESLLQFEMVHFFFSFTIKEIKE